MINSPQLLKDLQRLLKSLEDDLRVRVGEVAELDGALLAEWRAAGSAGRTAETFETWREEVITQAGVHWLLSCVFLRFIEDNHLVDRPWLAGPVGERLALARDRHEAYFRAHPTESDREYLIACFREAESLPGLAAVFDERHNPVFRLGISGDAAMALLSFWQKVDPDSGHLAHDFSDPDWNTRFLGDLYQDLSEATRKRYALLQTPEFVEEFILERTLSPAIREFGYQEVTLIDPTCGSGHFLLGAYQRLLDIRARSEPGNNLRDTVQKVLDAIHGVDLNPYAVAVARFRLLIAALKGCGETRLAGAPAFRFNLAAGDSLLHGPELGRHQDRSLFDHSETHQGTALSHAFETEDLAELNRILGKRYAAVVGNPPYITVKDAALNGAYRRRYKACHMKYSLGVPFTERFFELAMEGGERQGAGFVGLITTNSFMKREFGSKLIEVFLPTVDLTHVIDTSGAYIPGHGTPTVILFGRDRRPLADTVRTVMGIKGEPATPDDPAFGLVWRAIVEQLDRPGSESAFVSVADTPRATFAKYPWSMGGGGAVDLKEVLEARRPNLDSIADSIGITCFTLEDDVYVNPRDVFARHRVPKGLLRGMVSGDELREWNRSESNCALFPYDSELTLVQIADEANSYRFMWPYRTDLGANKMFGKQTKVEAGLAWWEYGRLTVSKLRTPLTITFGEITTHNHFVLDRGGKVFNRTAPVIKLPEGASEEDHLGLLGLLNSSVACFWLKQVCHNKGSTVDQHGARQRTAPFEDFYAFNSTKVAEFPLVESRPLDLAKRLDDLAQALAANLPEAMVGPASAGHGNHGGLKPALQTAKARAASLRRQMIAWQEELDWRCYQLYGLTEIELGHPNPPEIALGERAFEIVLARRMAAGQEESTWFARHGSTPITELPAHWPEDYRRVVEERIALIESDRNIALIERPEYKRRWNSESWEEQEKRALRSWLLDRLEEGRYWSGEPQLKTVSRLADLARRDEAFMAVAEVHAGRADFDLANLVADLVGAEAVPFLPVLRYTESGLRKRAQWQDTWAMQRREDAGEKLENIPVPPKYQSKDFLKADFWRLRGGLDVAKERWVSLPGCERDGDPTLPLLWAGWNALQQATALSAYALDMKEREGWDAPRLQPLLAGLLELLPWLKQWHNDYDPEHALRMGDYFAGFVSDEARSLGYTLEDLAAWKPAPSTARRGRKKAS